MKIQMKRKRISIFLCVSLLVSFLWGCSQNAATETNSAAELKTIGEPPVAMKEVTQDSYDSTVTFRLKIPQDSAHRYMEIRQNSDLSRICFERI